MCSWLARVASSVERQPSAVLPYINNNTRFTINSASGSGMELSIPPQFQSDAKVYAGSVFLRFSGSNTGTTTINLKIAKNAIQETGISIPFIYTTVGTGNLLVTAPALAAGANSNAGGLRVFQELAGTTINSTEYLYNNNQYNGLCYTQNYWIAIEFMLVVGVPSENFIKINNLKINPACFVTTTAASVTASSYTPQISISMSTTSVTNVIIDMANLALNTYTDNTTSVPVAKSWLDSLSDFSYDSGGRPVLPKTANTLCSLISNDLYTNNGYIGGQFTPINANVPTLVNNTEIQIAPPSSDTRSNYFSPLWGIAGVSSQITTPEEPVLSTTWGKSFYCIVFKYISGATPIDCIGYNALTSAAGYLGVTTQGGLLSFLNGNSQYYLNPTPVTGSVWVCVMAYMDNANNASNWCSWNKITTAALTRINFTPSALSNLSSNITASTATTVNNRFLRFQGVWNNDQIDANPSIPWASQTGMEDYFYSNGTSVLVPNLAQAIPGASPISIWDADNCVGVGYDSITAATTFKQNAGAASTRLLRTGFLSTAITVGT